MPSFGFQVAADGGGYTWSQNSRDNQLTPWSNDPVSDRPGEVLYVRDLDTGDVWTPTALPIRHERARYIVRHGRGYSRFEVDGQRHRARAAAVRGARTIRSRSRGSPCATSPAGRAACRSRPMSNGCSALPRGASAPTIVTERDAATGAIFARNPWNIASRVARRLRRSRRQADRAGPATAANSSAATAPPAIPRR